MHPRVKYIYEPYDLWAAIHPATDFLQLYSRDEHHCLLDAGSATSLARSRFQRLMSSPPDFTLVEKSPVNALRIGFLDAIAPSARFVHIIRDGVDVACSIERIAANTRRLAFRPSLNNWWGVGSMKWAALEFDGIAAGHYPDEVSQLTTDAQRGAYEWLLSLHEVNAWRGRLGSRLIELRLDDLINESEKDPRIRYRRDGPVAIRRAVVGSGHQESPPRFESLRHRTNPACSNVRGLQQVPGKLRFQGQSKFWQSQGCHSVRVTNFDAWRSASHPLPARDLAALARRRSRTRSATSAMSRSGKTPRRSRRTSTGNLGWLVSGWSRGESYSLEGPVYCVTRTSALRAFGSA